VQSDHPIVSGDLAQPCPELPVPIDGKFTSILEAYMEAARYYYDCSESKVKLVELINSGQ
jgi:hypothetical protein